MFDESRVRNLERLIEQERRANADLRSRIAALEQAVNKLGSGPLPGSDDSGGGTYYADPGSTVIPSDDSADLTVTEVRMAGDVEVGERTVINRYPDDTLEDARLILSKNRDGSYTVVGQGCAPEGG